MTNAVDVWNFLGVFSYFVTFLELQFQSVVGFKVFSLTCYLSVAHRVSKLLDSLSLGSGSSKLAKLFHSSSSSKKLNPAMQYLLQAGPQGLVRIWPMALSEETNYCSFLVSMTTTCREVVRLVFEKYEPIEDPRRFYICEVNLGKGGRCQGSLQFYRSRCD